MKAKDVVLNVDYVRSYMIVHGITERQLADKIGVSPSMLNRAMNGKRGIGSKVIAGVMANLNDATFSQFFSCVNELTNVNIVKKNKSA